MNTRRISLINPNLIRPSQLFDSFFDEFMAPNTIGDSTGLKTILTDNMEIDMYETDSHVMVEAKVPGFKSDNLSINVEDNILVIEGTVKEENEQKEGRKYHIKEMKSQSIYRSVMIPCKVDAERAEAEFSDGMVKISLPKLGDSKPKAIQIKTKQS